LDDDVRKSAIDALSLYKEKGIGAITEIVDASYNNEVRTYSFNTIKKVKQQNTTVIVIHAALSLM
jgi:hypothetical protein